VAATVTSTKNYDTSGGVLREDLSDLIYDISPMDTFFLSNVGRGKADSTTHEWLTDTLTAASNANKFIEGDAYSAQSRTLPSRLKNYTQISRKEFAVTGTVQASNNAGMDQMMAYHTMRAGKELKRDIEACVLANNPASSGTSTSPRVSGGVPNWIYENNHIKLSGQTVWSTTAPVSGFATATIPGASTTAIAESDLKSALAQAWSCGGDVDTLLCTQLTYGLIAAFTGLATRFRNVDAGKQAQITGSADSYVSAFGTHKIRLSRYMPTATLYCLDMSSWQIDYLRGFQTIDIAKISDEERKMMLAEWTLVAKTPLANTKINGILNG
jgi:hypothetical protein